MAHTPYLVKPGKESCYEYLLGCYNRISADVGDYAAFVNLDCKTMMTEMFADIEKLASFLVSKGIKQGDVVTAFLPTSPHAFIAFYTLSKIGAIANFVHPLTPPAALEEILKKTNSKCIFILDRAAGAYADIIKDRFTLVCSVSDYTKGKIKELAKADDDKNSSVPEGEKIFRFADALNSAEGTVPTVVEPGHAPAVYLHGSGTTGKSKTVILSAIAINNVAYGSYYFNEKVPHDYGNSYSLCILPCFHSFGISSGIHFCTCNAFSGIIMPKFDPRKANDYISRYNVQYISGAPTMFMKMLEQDNFFNDGLKNLVSLYSGGDIVSESFIQKFNAILKENGSMAQIFRGWGLTEMAGVCTTNFHGNCKAESIGKGITGMKIKAIDENGNDLPFGVNGELCTSCDTIMNGYLPDGTADNDGIYVDENGEKWVHTGDMGYVDEEGYVFFTGRKKRIIIISAYNIYPYSIEQKVMTLPFIDEACAVQGYDDNAKPLVKLCISLKDKTMPEDEVKAKVLAFCEENLENKFSVPRKIVIMDTLPRTKMAKLDFMSMSDPVPR